ncbi:MAG: phosphoribosyltransferase [Candidatus Verstraetearchaeota archaeon]|nr:phosphoribosyltransferase [Candidatus Verstraetearchaeota archaeon]
MELVKPYTGETHYEVSLANITRKLPLARVDEGTWIASDAELVLGDVEFITAAAKLLAEKIKPFNPEIIVTPEAKSLSLTYEVAKQLGHKFFVVARKDVKAYMGAVLVEEVKSITTGKPQMLVFTQRDANRIQGRRVCILDDVVSTGNTLRALERLVKRARGIIACKAAIWLEGPWCADEQLIFLSTLPIFIRKNADTP